MIKASSGLSGLEIYERMAATSSKMPNKSFRFRDKLVYEWNLSFFRKSVVTVFF